jgi:hypothetical protein
VAALSPNERTQTRTQSDLLKKLQSLAAEAEQAKSASEVGGETADANLTLTNLFTDLRVEKKRPSERAARDQQLQNLSEEQRDFLEKRARMRRQQSGGR